jgi:hypothetical protein
MATTNGRKVIAARRAKGRAPDLTGLRWFLPAASRETRAC